MVFLTLGGEGEGEGQGRGEVITMAEMSKSSVGTPYRAKYGHWMSQCFYNLSLILLLNDNK